MHLKEVDTVNKGAFLEFFLKNMMTQILKKFKINA